MAARQLASLWRTQNFVKLCAIDPTLGRSGIGLGDVVLDVGAGRGTVTAALAARGARVRAIEMDPRLCQALQHRFADQPRVAVICADVLGVRLPAGPYKVFANPPFDIVTAVVTKLTEAPVPPSDVYLVMQAEAADRYRGRPLETLYALLLKPWFAPTIVHRFRRNDFRPAPSVDVVMLRLRKRGPPLVDPSERRLYRDFVTACFTAWQPSLASALARAVGRRAARQILAQVPVEPSARPSDVHFKAWLDLFTAFARMPREVTGAVLGAERHLRAQQGRLRKRHRTRVPRDDPSPPEAIALGVGKLGRGDRPDFAAEHRAPIDTPDRAGRRLGAGRRYRSARGRADDHRHRPRRSREDHRRR